MQYKYLTYDQYRMAQPIIDRDFIEKMYWLGDADEIQDMETFVQETELITEEFAEELAEEYKEYFPEEKWKAKNALVVPCGNYTKEEYTFYSIIVIIANPKP